MRQDLGVYHDVGDVGAEWWGLSAGCGVKSNPYFGCKVGMGRRVCAYLLGWRVMWIDCIIAASEFIVWRFVCCSAVLLLVKMFILLVS